MIHQSVLQTLIVRALEDRFLIVPVLGQTFDLGPFNRQSAFILLNPAAREDTDFYDRALDPRRNLERGIANIRSLFTEDRAKKFFFRRHRRFALRRHLTDKNIAWSYLRPDVDDARLIQIRQRFFTDIRNIAGDFFLAQLGIARHHFEFLDVYRGEDILTHDALGHQN